MSWTTPDLCDRFPDVRVAEPLLRHYGGTMRFHGPVATVRCFEDNSHVRELASTPGEGRVMVVDGGGSLRRALLGDQIAAKAVEHGWAGFVVFGCVRDVEALAQLPLGVLALAAHPVKTEKRGLGDTGVAVQFAGIAIAPGDWAYADVNGLLVATGPLAL